MHQALEGQTLSMTYNDNGVLKARVIGAQMPVPDARHVQPVLNDVYLSIFQEEAGHVV